MGIDSSLRGYYFTGFVELLDGKNRLVFPAKWRPSFIERYHSIGSDLMRKKDRCFGLHMMQYKDKNPYIAFLDNAWFVRVGEFLNRRPGALSFSDHIDDL